MAGFAGIAMVVIGSAYILGDLADLADRTAQFGPAAWLEFDGHISLAMLVVNAGVLATIILVVLRRARHGPQPATNLDHSRGGPPTMLDDLAMAFQVIMRPNSTFAALRDDDRRYFRPSIVVMLLVSIVYIGLYLATPEAGLQIDYAAIPGLAILGGVITAGMIYLIGRGFSGNKNWRKVFTVIFYAEIIGIPMAVASSLLSLSSSLQSFSLQYVVGTVALAAVAWGFIVLVKAIKVLNGFGTAKAFGILILSGLVQIVWIILVALLYLWTIGFELPIMQDPLQ
ncbi:MAG: YIP1 family protein [Thaumarchaeota archaeon]|nr:YIP1 family protein [Nitrososphaerota archaeon]